MNRNEVIKGMAIIYKEGRTGTCAGQQQGGVLWCFITIFFDIFFNVLRVSIVIEVLEKLYFYISITDIKFIQRKYYKLYVEIYEIYDIQCCLLYIHMQII